MRSVTPMRVAKIGYIIMSVLLCVFGVLLIVVPDISLSVIGIVCGALFIVFGLVRLVGYFSKDLYRLAFQYDLAFGLLMIALGIIMLLSPESLMNFICIALVARPSDSSRVLIMLMGVSMLCEGLLDLGTVITAVKIIKHQQPDVIVVEADEESEG